MLPLHRFGVNRTKEAINTTFFIAFIFCTGIINILLPPDATEDTLLMYVILYLILLVCGVGLLIFLYCRPLIGKIVYYYFFITISSLIVAVKAPGDFSGSFMYSFFILYAIKNNIFNKKSLVFPICYTIILYLCSLAFNSMQLDGSPGAIINNICFIAYGIMLLFIELDVKPRSMIKLTEIELIYLKYLELEYDYQEIADNENVHFFIVEQHYDQLRQKAEVRTNVGLALWAKSKRLI